MISNFPNPRRMHCETGVLVNMLEYYGFKISEPMVFGIGGGLYFLFFPWIKINKFDMLAFRTLPSCIVRHFSKRMHLGYHEESFGKNREKAQKALDELLDKNVPVGLVVNLIGLKFLNDIGMTHDFNGHNLTVIGKEGSEYIIADTDEKLPNDDYVRLDETRLNISRFHSGVAAPHGKLYYFDPLPPDFSEQVDLKPAIIAGMKETSWNMLSVPFRFFGCKGIHYFANNLRKNGKKLSQEQMNRLFQWYYTLIEQGGTGGSGYRYIYSDFLKESATIFQSQALSDSAELMGKAADCWRQFTLNCSRHIGNRGAAIDEITGYMDEAADFEFKSLELLQKDFLKKQK